MKLLLVLVPVFLLAVLSNATPAKARSKFALVEMAKAMPREQLKALLKSYLSPAFKSAIDDSVINFLNTTVRDVILHGSEELGLPVLDPLKIEHLDVDLNFDQVQLTGALDGAQVSGISTFVVDLMKVNLLLLNVDFGLHIPTIEAKGDHYDIDGVVGDLIPIYGSGAFGVVLEGLSITGNLKIGSNNSFIYVKELGLDVTFTSLQTDIEGLLGGGELSDLVNEIISDVAPEVFEEAKPTLLPVLSDAVINLANEQLDGVTLQDLLNLINGGGSKKR